MLKILPEHLQIIRLHAEETYPNECCGLLIGKLNQGEKTLVEVLPTENSWEEEAELFQGVSGSDKIGTTRRERFAIAPRTLLQVQKETRTRGLDIIGVYHSHPNHPAIPSEFDRAIAWQEYSYIIVSVQQGKAADLRNWKLDENHQFQPEEIITLSGYDEKSTASPD